MVGQPASTLSGKEFSRFSCLSSSVNITDSNPKAYSCCWPKFWPSLFTEAEWKIQTEFRGNRKGLLLSASGEGNTIGSCLKYCALPPPFHEECAVAKSLQLCLTLCKPMDCSLPGSSIHAIFQARVLEWVAIAFFNEECRGLHKARAHSQESVKRNKADRILISSSCIISKIVIN